ncbi:MAG: DUF2339 domain-containing protein [Rhizobiales bacterium]|nr:DUF2339 domain-containing protein [Hyphomicrobiales bacterium]
MEIALAVLLVLSFPIIAIVGLVIAMGARDRARVLEQRFADFQKAQPAAPASAEAPQPPRRHPAPPSPADVPVEPAPPSLHQRRAAAAASVPPSPPPPTPPSTPPEPAEPVMGFEERLGTQWTVWVGGVALALGGFFLVRYSIEQGLFGPGMRVALGGLLALALIAAGEWARRKENLSGVGGLPAAHIPSILTAAGTAVAYADIWAAFALYEFIGPGTAFALLGIVAMATLAAALLHGPALAGLGLIGAYVTPLIVTTDKPNFWALYLYIAVVTAAAFMLARARMWRWLAVTAVAFGLFWTLPGLALLNQIGVGAHAFHVVAGFALVATFIVSDLLFGPDAAPGKVDPISSGALAAYMFGALLIVLMSRHETLALIVFIALTAAVVAIAWRTEAAAAAVPLAGVMVALMFLQYSVNANLEHLVLPSGPTAGAIPEPQHVFYGTHLALGAGLAALFGGAGFLAQGRSTRSLVPVLWAASAVFVPLAILIALYYRITRFEQSLPFAGIALLLAALLAIATETLSRREPRPGSAAAAAIFATGAVAALALAFAMALEKGWLTVALALMVPGVAWIADKRPLPALRILVGVLVAGVLARIAYDPAIVGLSNLGTTPVFNWLLWGYGIPAAAFWLGGHLLRRRADDVPARMADSAALLFGVLLAFLEVRHYMSGGDIFRPSSGLNEIALHVNVGLAIAVGLEWLRQRTGSIIHNAGALIIAALAFAAIVFGLAFVANPMIWPYDVGGGFFNLILLGYGLPAVLAATLALVTRGHRPPAYSQFAALVAVALALAYLSLQVRRTFHGPVLAVGPTTDAEQYAYSAVWLIFGVLLLAIGVALKSQAVRLASAAVVILTVLKVFFVDMRDLTGFYQAISFIGLGAVLMGIGLFYQRLLFPRRAPSVALPSPNPTA